MLFSILISLNFLTVIFTVTAEESKHEPQVAFWCGKVNQHIDLKTGKWTTDTNGKSMCADVKNKSQVLLYCQHTYPSLKVTNVVEANEPVAIDNWCNPKNVDCKSSKTVVPIRCLVGPFEADALLVPKGCRFGHLHKGSECANHDVWHTKAKDKCKDQGMRLKNYGILIPCGNGLFTGVEYVCCPKDMVQKSKESKHHVKKLIGGREDVGLDLKKKKAIKKMKKKHQKSLIEKLEDEAKKYPKHLLGKVIGCDHKKYHQRRQKIEADHDKRMSKVIKQWENAEKRYNILKDEDVKQAKEMLAGVLDRFKKIVATLEEQVKLERLSLHSEHAQCMQIDLNDKKNRVLRSFLKALKRNPVDENAILKAMRKFMNISTEDRIHNHHQFERLIKNNPDNAERLRQTFQAHLKHINDKVNHTMQLLYKVPHVARKFVLELPPWAPRLYLPTEEPTTTEPKTVATIKDESKNKALHRFHDILGNKLNKHFMGASPVKKPRKKYDPEDKPENEEEYFEAPRSPATFAVVIGLSCGALVIMVIIIIAMVMKKSRLNNPTRTVLVDSDADPNSEKQHLANLQQNGYENPIYKLTSY